MSSVTDVSRPIPNPVVVLREEPDDWAILFNPDTCEAVGTNPTGVMVWKLMDGRRSLADLVGLVQAEMDGVPESAVEEIRQFVVDLSARGFVGYESGS